MLLSWMKHIKSVFLEMDGTRYNMNACSWNIAFERKRSCRSTTLVWLKPEGKAFMDERS